MPAVALDVAFGEKARKKGLMYDVDMELLRSSMLAGGVKEEDLGTYPVIIRPERRYGQAGSFDDVNPRNGGDPAIELFAYKGEYEVSTKAAAHEGKHLADHLEMGEQAFSSPKVRIARKMAATALALGLSVGYFFTAEEVIDIQAAHIAIGIFDTDVWLAAIYGLEYLQRGHERRARKAAKHVVDRNVLLISRNGEPYQPSKLKKLAGAVPSVLKRAVVPDFRL